MNENESNLDIEDSTEKAPTTKKKTASSSGKKSSPATTNTDVVLTSGENNEAPKKTSGRKKSTKSTQNSEVAKNEKAPAPKKKSTSKKKAAPAKKYAWEEDDVGMLDLDGVKKLIHSTYSTKHKLDPDNLEAYIDHLELTVDEYDELITEFRDEGILADDEINLDDGDFQEISEEDSDDDEEEQRRKNSKKAKKAEEEELDDSDDSYKYDDSDSKNISTFSLYSKTLKQYALLTAEQEVELAKKMEAGKEAQGKLDQADKGELELSDEEREQLGLIAEEGVEAKDTLIQSNLKLVMKIAHYYLHRGMEYEDLVQEGTLGLMKATDKFDYRKGFKFSTYATWWIRQSITRAIADLSRTIRVPVHMVESINRVNKAKGELIQKYNRDPTLEELCEELGDDFTIQKLEEVLKYSMTPISLEKPVGDDDSSHIEDFQADTSYISPYDYAENAYKTDVINDALDKLLPREALVIRLRYGLADGKIHKLDEIGRELNVTRERIRQIESTALNKLKKMDSIKALRDKPDKKY